MELGVRVCSCTGTDVRQRESERESTCMQEGALCEVLVGGGRKGWRCTEEGTFRSNRKQALRHTDSMEGEKA